MTNNPELAGKAYKDFVQQRYIISRHINTSYNDTGSITPLERRYILEFIKDELQRHQDALEKIKNEK